MQPQRGDIFSPLIYHVFLLFGFDSRGRQNLASSDDMLAETSGETLAGTIDLIN
jgi:hypothetical protein